MIVSRSVLLLTGFIYVYGSFNEVVVLYGEIPFYFYLQNLILEISRMSGSSGSRFWDFSYYLKLTGSHKSSNSWPSINRDFFPEDLVHKKCNLLIFFLIFLQNKTGGASRRIQSKITK